jgi:hypothetical protein
MGGSNKVSPEFITPPDVGGLRHQGIGLLTGLYGDFESGQNPFYSGYGGYGQGFDIMSMLTGQGGQAGSLGAAGRSLQEGIETGFSPDVSPIGKYARQSFSQEMAPAVQEALGARYGIKFGGTVADSLSRAGERADVALDAQLLPYMDAAANRRMSLTNLPFQLQEMERGGRQQSLYQLLNALIAGPGAFGTGGQWSMPQYSPGTMAQLAPMIGTVAGGAMGGPMGAALGGAITSGFVGQQPGPG